MLNAILSLLLIFAPIAYAQVATSTQPDPLQTHIDESTVQIAQLKMEILQLQTRLTETGKQKQTLQSAVAALNLNIQKITKSVTLTQTQIKQKDSQISTLSGTISTTTSEMSRVQLAVGDSLQQLQVLDQEPLAFLLLAGNSLSSFFDEAEKLSALRIGLEDKTRQLSSLKQTLVTNKSAAQQKRNDLAALQQNLAQQKQSLAVARDAQSQLLAETKNKESNYQALIAQKQAQEAKFEQDLANYAAQQNKSFNSSTLPSARPGILHWPLDSVRITQYFGNTQFATQNPQIYGGKGHNAIDLAASPGTPIKAARGGTVVGTGNTDLQKGCYSYGKWIFIQHDNGLSTLYTHLSVISASKGQGVAGGQVIGYSGSTGYATGPHLHFGVYATAGSEIVQFTKSVNCKNVSIPVVNNTTAYLNPLSYLPSL
ncbi:MAG: peptidoglycan DD-metalloendopeptidase family protein [bacterium]|nr:peptidoglycan DD-metalloendopeptidase family protein [bacterium]